MARVTAWSISASISARMSSSVSATPAPLTCRLNLPPGRRWLSTVTERVFA